MEELVIKRIEDEIKRFNEILKIEDDNNLTLQEYKTKYQAIKEYLEYFLIDIKKIINNPIIKK